jgi:hypothetical protein
MVSFYLKYLVSCSIIYNFFILISFKVWFIIFCTFFFIIVRFFWLVFTAFIVFVVLRFLWEWIKGIEFAFNAWMIINFILLFKLKYLICLYSRRYYHSWSFNLRLGFRLLPFRCVCLWFWLETILRLFYSSSSISIGVRSLRLRVIFFYLLIFIGIFALLFFLVFLLCCSSPQMTFRLSLINIITTWWLNSFDLFIFVNDHIVYCVSADHFIAN